MYPLFETIRLEGGKVLHFSYHAQRMLRSANVLFKAHISFLGKLLEELESLSCQERHRCKVYYNQHEYKLEVSEYTPRRVHRVLFIRDDDMEYSLKYSNRQCIDKHVSKLAEGEAPIFIKNHFISDSSYANLALWNGRDWLTPSTPLLQGTKRAYLLEKNIIKEAFIRIEDIHEYSKLMLINAMLDWEEIVISI